MFSNPLKNLKAIGLRETDIVADVGAGTGHYTITAGHLVPKGKVYAIEIQKDFLITIKHKIKEAHLNNVETLWGNIEKIGGTKLGDSIVDVVIASNILSQVEDRDTCIEEIKRILKPKGKILLVDWSSASYSLGLKIAIPKNEAKELFEKKGFIWERDIDAGAHHYGMIVLRN